MENEKFLETVERLMTKEDTTRSSKVDPWGSIYIANEEIPCKEEELTDHDRTFLKTCPEASCVKETILELHFNFNFILLSNVNTEKAPVFEKCYHDHDQIQRYAKVLESFIEGMYNNTWKKYMKRTMERAMFVSDQEGGMYVQFREMDNEDGFVLQKDGDNFKLYIETEENRSITGYYIKIQKEKASILYTVAVKEMKKRAEKWKNDLIAVFNLSNIYLACEK